MRNWGLACAAAILLFSGEVLQAANLRFAQPKMIDRDPAATSVAIADIDHDGALDIVASTPEGLKILYGDMRGGVTRADVVAMPAHVRSLRLADLNQDGVADIIANTDDGVWNVLSSQRAYAAPQRAGKGDAMPAMVDLNGDGFADQVIMDGRSKSLFVRLADGRGGFGLDQPVELPDVVTSFAIADFDGDGNVDIAASVAFSNQVSIFLGDGRGGFTPASSIDAGEVPLAIAAGDIDRNGHIDLVVAYAKGIGFIPNVTERHFEPPAPSRSLHTQSLRPAPEFGLPPAPCTIFFTFLGGFDWNQPFNWADTSNVQRLPNGSDTACINDSPGKAGVIFVSGNSGVGSVQSTYHPGIQINGSLNLIDSAHSSRFQAVTIAGGSLTSSGPVTIGSPVDAGSITLLFGGSMFIVGPNDGSDAMTVNGAAHWESGSVRAVNGPIRFWNDSQVFGQLNLCENTTLILQPGTTMSLNGVITPCSTGFGTLNLVDSTVSGNGNDNAGIYVNITTSTAGGAVKPSFVSTGTGPFILGNHFLSNAVESLNAHLTVGAGTTIDLGGNVAADVVSSDGPGTTVVSGFVHGILTPINSPLNVGGGGRLFAAPGDRADFTSANGPVTLGGSIIGHNLTIFGNGSQLNSPCIANGGVVEVRGTITSSATGSVIDGSCAPGAGVFRVNFFTGSLTVPASLVSNPGVEFEGEGTVNVQGGTLTIWDSPLGQGSQGGRFNLAAGTNLLLLHEYNLSSSTISGDGLLEVGALLHTGGTTIQNLQSGADIDGSFTVTGSWQYGGGTISNGTATVAGGATMNGGPNGGRFSNSFVSISGTANLVSACVMNGASFNVNFGGVANVTPPFGTIALGTCGSNGSLRVNPNGRLLVNVTGRTAMVVPSSIFGTMEVAGNGPMTYLAPSTWFAGSQLIVDGGATVDFQDSESFSNLQSNGGGAVKFTFSTFSGSSFFASPVTFDNAHFGGGGNMILGCCFNTSTVASNLTIDSGNTLTINWGLNVGAGAHLTNNGTIQNNGTLNVSATGSAISGSGSISNSRTISGGSPGGTSIDNPITNGSFGHIIANSGSLTTMNLTNNSGGTLTGGSYEADSNSTLFIGSVTNNAANLTANGGSARLTVFNLQSNSGNISLANGGTLSASSFTNTGNVGIGAGSTFSAFTFTQAAGNTTLTDPTAQINAQTVLQGGILAGYGTISPSLQNLGGELRPYLMSGFTPAPGTMTVQGNYTEGPGAFVHINISDQTHYSSLHVTGSASLAGTIQLDPVTFDDGFGDVSNFFPNPGDAFKVLTYASRAGSFATIIGQDQTFLQDYLYMPHYNATDLTFIVETQDPKVLIANLEGTVNSFGLDQGTATAVNSKLDAALASLQRGDTSSACGQLSATVNYALAQAGKKLTQDQAAAIIAAVQRIQAKIGCK